MHVPYDPVIPHLRTQTYTYIGGKWHINKAIHCSVICNSNWLELSNRGMVDCSCDTHAM